MVGPFRAAFLGHGHDIVILGLSTRQKGPPLLGPSTSCTYSKRPPWHQQERNNLVCGMLDAPDDTLSVTNS